MYKTLDDLSSDLSSMGKFPADYYDRMYHKIPNFPVLPSREVWLIERVKKCTVLHIGCAGPLDVELRKSAKRCYGIDLQNIPGRPDFFRMDVETSGCPLPDCEGVDTVILAEILEHLTMPGLLLRKVKEKYSHADIIITVPNAFSRAGRDKILKGLEHVNSDHTAWFSYKTIHTLLEKCKYQVKSCFWYNAPNPKQPWLAEGLVLVCRA